MKVGPPVGRVPAAPTPAQGPVSYCDASSWTRRKILFPIRLRLRWRTIGTKPLDAFGRLCGLTDGCIHRQIGHHAPKRSDAVAAHRLIERPPEQFRRFRIAQRAPEKLLPSAQSGQRSDYQRSVFKIWRYMTTAQSHRRRDG